MVQLGIEGEAMTVPSADERLIEENADALCTSDSNIIDRTLGKIIDLPRFLLEKYFQAKFPILPV
jgi:hypothetical protein